MDSEETQSGVWELQGPYGPIQISERFLQLIWFKGRFDQTDLRTEEGKTISLIHPGQWNHQEGPDFRKARWREDREVREGDVEIHFYPADWYAHGHDQDPAFNSVTLHVCLFPPEPGEKPVQTKSGQILPCLTMVARLEEDLESLAEEEGLLQLEQRDTRPWREAFLELSQEKQQERLWEGARKRWLRKVLAAEKVLEMLGWEDALHAATLEVLGYSRNRKPMRKVAQAFPYSVLRGSRYAVETLYLAGGEGWKLSGIRPANQPRKRLGQYLELISYCPEWPSQVFGWLEMLGADIAPGQSVPWGEEAHFRKQWLLSPARRQLAEELLNRKLSGNRLETWVTEALLPYFSAETGHDVFAFWQCWYPGDAPTEIQNLYRDLTANWEGRHIFSNGFIQGLLDLVIAEEAGYTQLEFKDLPDGFSDVR